MAKILRKCRLCRRERAKLFLKGERCFSPKCPIEKDGGTPPGDHGLKSGIRMSSYGKQLREKQKAKRIYGLSETKFKDYFSRAEAEKANTGELILQYLETRLDNVVYLFGFAPSRATARQLIVHGFVQVNNKKIMSPSFQMSKNDTVILNEKARKMEKVEKNKAKKEKLASWLEAKGFIGRVKALPTKKDMESEIDESLIVEYYSR